MASRETAAAMAAQLCVECGSEVKATVQEVRSSPASIRLSRCAACGHLADKYVERDTLLVLLDMLLPRASVYRHLLCNCSRHPSQATRRTRLLISGFILVLFEPFLMTVHLDHQSHAFYSISDMKHDAPDGSSQTEPAIVAFRFFLLLVSGLAKFVIFCTVVFAMGHMVLIAEQVGGPFLYCLHGPCIVVNRSATSHCL